jgi:hypothetical protein
MPRKPADLGRAAPVFTQRQLEAQLAARNARACTLERKRDTRRKIIVGAAVLAHAQLDPLFALELRAVLARAVQRPIDRDVLAAWLGE